jgi:hypothetical protein
MACGMPLPHSGDKQLLLSALLLDAGARDAERFSESEAGR